MPAYAIPTDPADPERAALELIVRLPVDILRITAASTGLQDYADALHARGRSQACRGTTPAISPPRSASPNPGRLCTCRAQCLDSFDRSPLVRRPTKPTGVV